MGNSTEVENLEMQSVKDAAGSLVNFFSIISGVILSFSMSYSIGYFKYINPQFVELFSIGDYLNEAAHNVWLFVIAIILFFSSSIAFVKRRISGKFEQTILLGVFTLVACSYTFFRGISYNKFWPVIEYFLKDNVLMPVFIFILLTFVSIAALIAYKVSFRVTVKKEAPLYYVNILPVLIFLLIVLTPYLAGMIQGYTESSYLTKKDYTFQLVDIVTLPNLAKLKDILIIRRIDKGLIIRQFEKNSIAKSSYSFLSWPYIQQIVYNDAYKAKIETD